MRSFPLPPESEKPKEKPKRFIVERYGSDKMLEANLNRYFHEGYELRSITYDAGLKRGAWGVVLENPMVSRNG